MKKIEIEVIDADKATAIVGGLPTFKLRKCEDGWFAIAVGYEVQMFCLGYAPTLEAFKIKLMDEFGWVE